MRMNYELFVTYNPTDKINFHLLSISFPFPSSDVQKPKAVHLGFASFITLLSVYAFLELSAANGVLIALPPERARKINSGCVNSAERVDYLLETFEPAHSLRENVICLSAIEFCIESFGTL